jgi:hypothetical protein
MDEHDEAHAVRRYFLIRIAVIAAAAWVLSWPLHVLPRTVFWSLLAAAVFAFGLMSPPRRQQSTPNTAPKPSHRE